MADKLLKINENKNLEHKQKQIARVNLLVLDVDGVLTDGTLIVNSDGSESKFFNTLDGHGIRLWRRAGLKIAFLSGRDSKPTQVRAEQLEVDFCFQNCHEKLPVLKKLVSELGLNKEQVVYAGDDLPDLPCMRYAGFSVAVSNAVEQVRSEADYITEKSGGNGAVREIIEYILQSAGRWDELMVRYLP